MHNNIFQNPLLNGHLFQLYSQSSRSRFTAQTENTFSANLKGHVFPNRSGAFFHFVYAFSGEELIFSTKYWDVYMLC